MLTVDELRAEVESGRIDTVVAAFTDMQGRLLGKREDAEYFVAESVEHGLEGCNYLLGLDMDHSASLPPDDSGYGFDNIGGLLTVSPLLMEKYMATARRVSRTALGTAKSTPLCILV